MQEGLNLRSQCWRSSEFSQAWRLLAWSKRKTIRYSSSSLVAGRNTSKPVTGTSFAAARIPEEPFLELLFAALLDPPRCNRSNGWVVSLSGVPIVNELVHSRRSRKFAAAGPY